jgi:peptidoglycan hydrolase-like protein with peptidoglycan-binding domain
VALNLMEQGKPHPAPLFLQQELVAKNIPPLPAKLFQASYEQQDEAGDIRDAQTRLAELGIYKGALDGRMGPKTAEAIRSFQTRSGLEVTGAIDLRLMARLQDGEHAAVYETDSILIFTVQHRLNELGYDAGDENGSLSAKTQNAIRKFEAEHDLPVTGAIRGLLLSALTSAKLAAKH